MTRAPLPKLYPASHSLKPPPESCATAAQDTSGTEKEIRKTVNIKTAAQIVRRIVFPAIMRFFKSFRLRRARNRSRPRLREAPSTPCRNLINEEFDYSIQGLPLDILASKNA
jgi:hypothetical protein